MAESLIMNSEAIELKERVNRNLLYIAIFSILMLFAGLTSAYIVRQADGNWLRFSMPSWFQISTIVMLLSSATMAWAQISARSNKSGGIKIGLGLTIILGSVFCVLQFYGWSELLENGIYLAGKSANPSGSFLYLITGMHMAHIASGLIYLLVIFFKSLRNKYNSTNYTGVRHSAIYWHFLGALWLYLYVFFLAMQ